MTAIIDEVDRLIKETETSILETEKQQRAVEVEANKALSAMQGQIVELKRALQNYLGFREKLRNPDIPLVEKKEELPSAPPELPPAA